jgi:hypothetical protein
LPNIAGSSDELAEASLGEAFAFAQGGDMFAESHINRLKARYKRAIK